MEQLTLNRLLPREKQAIAPDVWHIPNWLPIPKQEQLVEQVKTWTKGRWKTPKMLDGTPMNHPIACLGWDWEPYQYTRKTRELGSPVALARGVVKNGFSPLPVVLSDLYAKAVSESLFLFSPQGSLNSPDTALVNWFPVGSSLGMHQDRSEDSSVIAAGSPIVTISLGNSAIFRLGNTWNREKPYQDIELQSGDVLIMGGINRLAFHGVPKIFNESTAALPLKQSGRISITIRQARPIKE